MPPPHPQKQTGKVTPGAFIHEAFSLWSSASALSRSR